jgi:translocation and assembly module TamA
MTPRARGCGLARLARQWPQLLLALWLAQALVGCASLGGNNAAAPAGSATAATPPGAAASAPERAEYQLEVIAPEALRPLLLNYLDLARFQNAPATEGITSAELDRLVLAAPAQARSLLETEGYFNPVVKVARVTATSPNPVIALAGAIGNRLSGKTPSGAGDGPALPLLRVEVEPGPRATVTQLTLDVTGALLDAVQSQDTAATQKWAGLRSQWSLQPGQPFRQGSWSSAKAATLAQLRAEGYPAATWQTTAAKVDAQTQSVQLKLLIDSGPLFLLGAIRIEGLERYDEASVRRLATFEPGTPYDDKLLLDYQERLQKLGLFEGAFIEIDPNPATAEAAPVLVRVKELSLQTATFGAGYSANTGPRITLEHLHRRVFGSAWVAKNKFEIGPDQKLWSGELISHPLEGLYRNLVAGSSERLRTTDELRTSWSARVGRTQDTQRIERLYYAEYVNARLATASTATNSDSDAISGNYHWVFRNVDSVLLPTQGTTLSAQAALGYARSSTADNGPFGRAYARLTGYWPLGQSWYGTARVEAGQVFAHDSVGVPDTLLFRAGGDDSVRGYPYRSLGPQVAGVVTSGRMLMTGSIEVARPISASRPAFWWALFADAGNASNRWGDLDPAYGYGVGMRWRSPVGPLRLDLAYGQRVHAYRVHLSVGIAF